MKVPKFRGLNSEELFNVQGGTGVVEGNVKFQQDVKHLLETPLGSVLGNLNYGSNLYRYIFLPLRESTGNLIQEEIKTRIENNYSDITVDNVDVTMGDKTINITIGFNNNNSNIMDYIEMDIEREGDING